MAAAALLACVAACTTRPAGDAAASRLVWPPAGVPAPGEVVFERVVDELKASGIRGFLGAVAGAEEGEGRTGFVRPVGAALAGEFLWVVDSVRPAVSVSALDGRSASFVSLPEGFLPVALAAAPGGREVWIGDGAAPRLRAHSRAGKFLREVALPPGFGRCGGIAVAANGDLLVTSVNGSEVARLGPEGTLKARVGRRGEGLVEFNFPGAVAVAPDGTIWVVDTFNFRLQHLSSDLKPLGGFGEAGDGTGHFALPKGLAIDPDGHLYVADGRFDAVQVFDSAGRLLLVVGGHGAGPGEFSNPAGLACDAEGRLVIADTGNRRAQVLKYQRRSVP